MTVPAIFFIYENALKVAHRRTFCAFCIVSSQAALCKCHRLLF